MQGLRGRGGPTRAGLNESPQTTRAALRRGLDGRGISTAKAGSVAAGGGGGRGSGPVSAAGGPTASGPANVNAPKAGHRRAEEQVRAQVPIVGDEELFAVEQRAAAVIERPKQKVHAKRPGPALGRA